MHLPLATCTLRSFRLDDAPSLARHANNRRIWRNLRDQFPHPYELSDAKQFITRCLASPKPTNLAIAVDGEAVGSIGLRPREDVDRVGAEFGYWLGEEYWGRGILSEAIPVFTRWALEEYQLLRLEAWVFEWNPASARVLEKAGYVRESTMRRSAIKDGQIIDRWMYVYLLE